MRMLELTNSGVHCLAPMAMMSGRRVRRVGVHFSLTARPLENDIY